MGKILNKVMSIVEAISMSVQFATRVDDELGARFKSVTRQLGTTPGDALRMFISSFDRCGGFPFEVRLSGGGAEPFENEREATDFADRMSTELLDETR